MANPIASIKLLGRRDRDDQSFEIVVEIGAPYRVAGREDEWACHSRIRPLYKDLRDARANDSLQSLCLAMSLVLDLLAGFTDKGGELFFENGEPFPLEAYGFGAALGRGDTT